MRAYVYVVRATFPEQALRDRYVHWLENEHIADVVKHGALEGWVDVLDEPPSLIVESRYLFPNRTAYETYVTLHAPGLRAQGLARFPLSTGITFERRAGVSHRIAVHGSL